MKRILTSLLLVLFNERGNFDFGQGSSGDGGGEGGQGDAGAPPTGSPSDDPNGGGNGISYSYPETLDKEYHGSPSLMKFADDKGQFDVGKIMKSYIHLEKGMGKDKILKPNENFTDEQWKETFRSLGVPEDLNDYKIENNLPEGVTGNEEFFKNFTKKAHEVGVLPKQAQALMDFYNDTVGAQVVKMQESDNAYKQGQLEILKNTWGDGLDKKMKVADQAAKHLLDENDYKEISNMGLFQNAAFAKLMAKVGEGLQDDSFNNEVKGSFGLTPDEVEDKIKSFYEPNHPFRNSKHPQHNHYAKEFEKLMEMRVKYQNQR